MFKIYLCKIMIMRKNTVYIKIMEIVKQVPGFCKGANLINAFHLYFIKKYKFG